MRDEPGLPPPFFLDDVFAISHYYLLQRELREVTFFDGLYLRFSMPLISLSLWEGSLSLFFFYSLLTNYHWSGAKLMTKNISEL